MRTGPDNRMMANALIVVGGPTASGKSALALDLARYLGGEVINADSMQVYRELRILTARPDEAALATVPHRLYGVLPGAERCSAGRWREMAVSAIAEAHAAGRVPILVGGTGLYLRALLEGLSDVPPIPPKVQNEVRALFEAEGLEGVRNRLAALDPEMAARLRPSDRQRHVRALEVIEATGRSLAAFHQPGRAGYQGGPIVRVVLEPPRKELRRACDARFGAMIEAGAIDEVRALLGLGLDPSLPAMKAVGVTELSQFLARKLSLEEAIERARAATRRYAKRQQTWFRHQIRPDVQLVNLYDPSDFVEIVQRIVNALQIDQNGLTG